MFRVQQDTSPFFQKLPLEIRWLVYDKLLIRNRVITLEEFAVGQAPEFISSSNNLELGIDSTFLRTCRQAYREGIMKLYSRNKFMFGSCSQIVDFGRKGLNRAEGQGNPKEPLPVFGFGRARQGRLAVLTSMHICFGDGTGCMMQAILAKKNKLGTPYYPDRARILKAWSAFFVDAEETEESERVKFPALHYWV